MKFTLNDFHLTTLYTISRTTTSTKYTKITRRRSNDKRSLQFLHAHCCSRAAAAIHDFNLAIIEIENKKWIDAENCWAKYVSFLKWIFVRFIFYFFFTYQFRNLRWWEILYFLEHLSLRVVATYTRSSINDADLPNNRPHDFNLRLAGEHSCNFSQNKLINSPAFANWKMKWNKISFFK